MAENIFLKLDGVPGSATEEGYKGQIVVDSFQFGGGVAVSGGTGKMGDRTAGKVSLADITITKGLDEATHLLIKNLTQGKVMKDATFTFVAATNAEAEKYLEVKLENVIISSFSQSSGGGQPTEAVSLNYTKIEFAHTLRSEKGDPTPKRASYDLKLNKAA